MAPNKKSNKRKYKSSYSNPVSSPSNYQRNNNKKNVINDTYSDDENNEEIDVFKNNRSIDYEAKTNRQYELPDVYDDEDISDDNAFNSEDEIRYGTVFTSNQNSNNQADEDDNSDNSDVMDDDGDVEARDPSNLKSIELLPQHHTSDSDDDIDEEAVQLMADDNDDIENSNADLLSVMNKLNSHTTNNKQMKINSINEYTMDNQLINESPHAVVGNHNKLQLSDLMLSVQSNNSTTTSNDKQQLNQLQKKLMKLYNNNKQKLLTPVTEPVQQRIQRNEQYAQLATELTDTWSDTIRYNKSLSSIQYGTHDKLHETTSGLRDKFQPSNSFETDINNIMQQYKLHTNDVVTDESNELSARQYTPDELIQHKSQLLHMKQLLYYNEQKLAKINKIKSKSYRRLRKKMSLKQHQATPDDQLPLSESLQSELSNKYELQRAKQRIKLQNRNTSAWIQSQLKHSNIDQNTRDELNQQLLQQQQLISKQLSMNHTDQSSSEDDSNDNDGSSDSQQLTSEQRNQKRVQLREQQLQELLQQPDTSQLKQSTVNLFNMKFMKSAAMKQQNDAIELLHDIQQHEDQYDNMNSDDDNNNDSTTQQQQSTDVQHGRRKSNMSSTRHNPPQPQPSDIDYNPANISHINNTSKTIKSVTQPITINYTDNNNNRNQGPVDIHITECHHHPSAVPYTNKLKKVNMNQSHIVTKQIVSQQSTNNQPPVSVSIIGDTSSSSDTTQSLPSTPLPQSDILSTYTQQSAPNKQYTDTDDHHNDNTVILQDDDSDTHNNHTPLLLDNKQYNSADQQQLIDSMFNTDATNDTINEFQQLKSSEVESQLPPPDTNTVPGWGHWIGENYVQKKSIKQLVRDEKLHKKNELLRQKSLQSRKDRYLPHVIINEKLDSTLIHKYQIPTLPYPYTTVQQFNKSLVTPLGKEFNTANTYMTQNKPSVIVRPGTIVKPISRQQIIHHNNTTHNTNSNHKNNKLLYNSKSKQKTPRRPFTG